MLVVFAASYDLSSARHGRPTCPRRLDRAAHFCSSRSISGSWGVLCTATRIAVCHNVRRMWLRRRELPSGHQHSAPAASETLHRLIAMSSAIPPGTPAARSQVNVHNLPPQASFDHSGCRQIANSQNVLNLSKTRSVFQSHPPPPDIENVGWNFPKNVW